MEPGMRQVTATQIVESLHQSERDQNDLAAAKSAIMARVVVATGGHQLPPESPLYQMIERGASTPRRPGPPTTWASNPTGYIHMDDSDRETDE